MAGKAVPSIQLIVGLGNPGPNYTSTRHNAGAWWVERLCQQFHLTLQIDPKFNARLAQATFEGKDYRVMIPNTYMNHSGQSVGAIAKYFQIPVETILVAHDELDIPPGTIRFKTGGGHGGHNGLRDIIHHLGNRDFHRLRIGIGHPGHKDEVSDYVLTKPSKEEASSIQSAIEEGLRYLPQLLNGDWQTVMNHLHRFSN